MSDGTKPTPPEDRIVSLDALRGFAILGILVINVWFFSYPLSATQNPTAYGDLTGLNFYAWAVSHVFFEAKFVTLFTLMFGAGIMLFTESKARKGQQVMQLHYRRTFWLLVIGLAHAYLLWYGDILTLYALCGFWVVLLRDMEAHKQVLVGLLLFTVDPFFRAFTGWSLEEYPEALVQQWAPSEAALQAEVTAYQSGWLTQMDHRVQTAFDAQTVGFLSSTLWRISGLMLLGMALYKWGVLTNDRSRQFYRRVFVGGALVGIALSVTGIWLNVQNDWSVAFSPFFGVQFNIAASLFLGLAYVSGIMLYVDRRYDVVTRALSAVGRTALSNYLFQTVVATTVFYGHGLGLFGTVTRVEQLGFVVLVWAVQIPLSVLWLRYFQFGPAEWVWRTLTYWERQPLRKDGT